MKMSRESKVESREPEALRREHSFPRHSTLDSRPSQRAFTLIEMVLAIGVAAIVLIAVNAVLFSALHLRTATSNAVDAAVPVDQALTLLRRDLQCAMTPTNGTSKVLSGDFRVGNLSISGESGTAAIELFTATGALSANQPWGDIQRVTYGLRSPAGDFGAGQELVRCVTRNLLSASTADLDEQVILSGVANIKFACFDGMQWNDTWDTTGLTSMNTNLPVAVRVDIQMAGNTGAAAEPIEILVPIDSQSRTNRS